MLQKILKSVLLRLSPDKTPVTLYIEMGLIYLIS